MAQEGGKQQNTAYGVFVQACWAQHKRQYPDELIHKEIEEFNKVNSSIGAQIYLMRCCILCMN